MILSCRIVSEGRVTRAPVVLSKCAPIGQPPNEQIDAGRKSGYTFMMQCRSSRELRRVFSWLCLYVLAILIQGCSRHEIRLYDAPKEKVVARADLPVGWEEQPTGGMRLASYVVHGPAGEEAQVSVIPLPESPEVDNVNRWRNQLGLNAITESEANSQAQEVSIGGERARMFELSGTAQGKPTRTLAALLKHAGSMWFFKMMGDDGLVRSQKDAFVKFLAQYQISHDDHSHDAPAGQTPAVTSSAEPTAKNPAAPATWKQVPPGPMQEAKFVVGEGKATVTLSTAGGGLLPNVNRWRGQIELPPVTEKDLETLAVPLDLTDAKGTLVDMRGPSQRLVVAIVPRGDKTWYFKLMGEDSTVGAEKNALIEFARASK